MLVITKKHISAFLPTFLINSLLGGSLIALSALIIIPFYPIPFTLQTLAIISLGLTQRPAQAFSSVITYLIAVSVGLPVLNGGLSNVFWMGGATAGYLVSFPFAAALISFLKTRTNPLLAIFCGQALIFASGFAWLATFIGAPLAWTKGVCLFLASDALKGVGAYSALRVWKKFKR